MPAAVSAAGIARKWEGSVASGPSNQPYQTGLPLRMPDRHDVRFSRGGSKFNLGFLLTRENKGFYRTQALATDRGRRRKNFSHGSTELAEVR